MTVHYKYLIVGGGMTADAAARAIRQLDADGSLALFSEEQDAPYNRPPLSKGLWKGRPLERIFRKTDALGVDLHLGEGVRELDARTKTVHTAQGEYTFDRLLLATGGSPIHLPGAPDGLNYYRTLQDYRRLRADLETGGSFAVIGGGYIGSELAAVLSNQGKVVSMIFPEDGICARIFSAETTCHLNDFYAQKGVNILSNQLVTTVQPVDGKWRLTTNTGHEITADGVIAGLGIRPNIELARQAGLTLENGIRVDASMATSHPDIFAAGDVASFYSPTLERWMRPEHEENANLTGTLAGQAMAGQPGRYEVLPSFYSDLFDIGYEGVGVTDPSRATVLEDWVEPRRQGVSYYLEGERVRGVIIWGMRQKLDQARALIAEKGPIRPADLTGRIRP